MGSAPEAAQHERTVGHADRVPEVVTVGETMAGLVSTRSPASPAGSVEPPCLPCVVLGAESNVAMALVGLDHRVAWVSRLGQDHLGDLVASRIEAAGVEVVATRDPVRPTGLMVKEIEPEQTRVRYYRRGSAASALDGDELDVWSAGVRWLHLTGVTPALSDTAPASVGRYIDWAVAAGVRVSFDLNFRPALWPDRGTAVRCLLDLCQRADLVFAGADEVEALMGRQTSREFATTIGLRADRELVYKLGADGAELVAGEQIVSEPASPPARIVDLTGAGDSFAAGYLAGTLEGLPARTRLRLGHLMARQALGSQEDVGPVPSAGELRELRAATHAQPPGTSARQ